MKKDYEKKNFTFDKIYPINSNQEEIFNISGKSVVDVSLFHINIIHSQSLKGTMELYLHMVRQEQVKLIQW